MDSTQTPNNQTPQQATTAQTQPKLPNVQPAHVGPGPTQAAPVRSFVEPTKKAHKNHHLLRTRYQYKRYRLKGYTTPSRVQRKYRRARRKNAVMHLLTAIIVLLLLIALTIYIRPLELISEAAKNMGFSLK